MIIDMHVHLADYRIYPRYWLDGIKKTLAESIAEESGVKVDSNFLNTVLKQSLSDMNNTMLIRQMDEAGIDQATILLADFGFGRTDYQYSIEELYYIHYEALCRYPNRFRVFAGIDPRRGKEGLTLFKKGIEDYGFSGLKLYPPCGFDLDDEQLYPYYEICNELRIPILTHVGPSLPSMRKNFRYPGAVLDITKKFSKMPIILGHAAIVYYKESRRLPMERDNIYLEVSGFQTLINSGLNIPQLMKQLMKDSEDRILFGTDWPLFRDSKKAVQFFKQLDVLSEGQLEKFFYKNALSIFSGRKNM